MKVHFKYPRKVEGELYGKGEHTLPDQLASHWYVKALIKEGDITVLDKAKVEEAPSQPQEKKKAK